MNIEIHYTEVSPTPCDGFRIPMTNTGLYPDIFRRNGYTAEVVDFNRLFVTSPNGCVQEFVVSYDMTGNDHRKMWLRSTDESTRFWKAVEAVIMARLRNTVRYINRHQW